MQSSVKKHAPVSKCFTIKNTLGLHARAAAQLVKLANRFRSDIKIRKGNTTVNGKSIMGVLMLAAAKGTEIELVASGPDAHDMIQTLGDLIEHKFYEE